MKVSVNWMQYYAGDVKILPEGGIDELVARIGAQLGAVEEVVNLGERYRGIVVAKVVSCGKHPDADKLQVCKIDDGGVVKDIERDENGHVQVVCGAPNVRSTIQVAWIPPGVVVPSTLGGEPFTLEARDIRGVVSNGMLASPHELAVSEDHSGILEIDEEAKPGDDFAKVYKLDDYVIDIENKMFTHRPDLFGQLGVAREIAGITGQQFKSPDWYLKSREQRAESREAMRLDVKNTVPELVPRFMAVVVSDMNVKPSPVWLQSYLSRVGIRPINNVVDITNYMMMETAQPLHAYDAGKLHRVISHQSSVVSLETRMSKKGEKLRLLGGKEIEFEDESTILITSGDIPVGIGGVMGGSETEVDQNTKSIVLECANFNMYSIRRASMKYGLFTDAVTRFNKGQSPLQNGRVLTRAVEMLGELAGGKVASEVLDIKSQESIVKSQGVEVSLEFINSRLGIDLKLDDVRKLLENVEFGVKPLPHDSCLLTPPFWRTDIEIPEDIVEEIGRLYGYDHLPVVLPKRTIEPPVRDGLLDLKAAIRLHLAAAGANEVLTYNFVHGDLLSKVGQDPRIAFQLSNALSPDLQYFRVSLLPSLLERVRPNVKAGYKEFAIFEINKAHNKLEMDQDEEVPKESNNLALVVTADQNQGSAAYYQARHYLDSLAKALGVRFRYEPFAEPPTHPAGKPFDHERSARIYLMGSDKILGVAGEFGSEVRRALKLPVHTAGFEISIGSLVNQKPKTYKPLSRYPSVQQDISLKVPAEIPYSAVYELMLEELSAGENIKFEFEPLDIYQGDDKAHKNLTFRLTIASYDKTMVAAEVNALLDKLAAKAHENFNAERL